MLYNTLHAALPLNVRISGNALWAWYGNNQVSPSVFLKKLTWILEGEAFFFPASYILDKLYKPVTI
jgi:hypothetical protein